VPRDAPITADVRLAAVLALVRVIEEPVAYAELLFIKRAEVAGDPFSGHIAFPGGRHDLTDETLADTALRETREELDIDVLRAGRMLGRLDDIAPRSLSLPRVVVRPFVAVVPATVAVTANREVADAFWVPVATLRSAEARWEHVVTAPDGSVARFPAYKLSDRVVWGMTERIVAQLLPLFEADAELF
jgi:8-oxo-dGTP pyrophosphatase MutT (NUDIX family)